MVVGLKHPFFAVDRLTIGVDSSLKFILVDLG